MDYYEQSRFQTALKLLLCFICVIQPFSSFANNDTAKDTVDDQLKQLKLEHDTLNRRVGLLEIENKDQKEDIQFLNAQLSEIKQNGAVMKTIHNQVESSNGAMIITREKRPARLFPTSILRGRKKEEDKPIIGLPSNCEDLNKMGHTLNAIYMVKGPDGSKIHSVFCNFQTAETRQHSSSPYSILLENKLGYVDVKSASGVYFYVQAFGNQSITASNNVIRFDMERLNIGGGMNLKSGVFLAPKTGTYAFQFSIMKNGYNLDMLDIFLRLNGTRIGYSTVSPSLMAAPLTLQSTLKLKRGDRVDLQKSKNGRLTECPIGYCHHFTGWLLEEDLEI